MTIFTIDGVEYDSENLSSEATAQIQSLQFVDSEISRMQASIAALQTARIAYSAALKDELETANTDAGED